MWSNCTCIAGHYAPALSDEDQEIDPDRWCSHSAWGQECWQLIAQWVGNLRLELGHQLHPDPVRTVSRLLLLSHPLHHTPLLLLAMPRQQVGSAWKAGRFAGQDFALQPDGTLRCPADQKLTPHEQRREADGSPAISCMEPASVIAVPVPCVSSVSGRARPPGSRARSASCCIRWLWGMRHFSGVTGVVESTDTPVSSSCA
jgi:hypothetical protein